MSLSLDYKIAIVTGGLSGIGAAIARRMVEEGANVISADLSSHETALGTGNPAPLRMDAQDPASVEHAIKEEGAARMARLHCELGRNW